MLVYTGVPLKNDKEIIKHQAKSKVLVEPIDDYFCDIFKKMSDEKQKYSNHQIIIQLDHFRNGMPITNNKIDKALGTVIFNDIYVAVDSIYIIGWLDIDSNGFASEGDPTLRQLDGNNNQKPIIINNGAVEINVEFDDSVLWQVN